MGFSPYITVDDNMGFTFAKKVSKVMQFSPSFNIHMQFLFLLPICLFLWKK